jgi:hypothetical protein
MFLGCGRDGSAREESEEQDSREPGMAVQHQSGNVDILTIMETKSYCSLVAIIDEISTFHGVRLKYCLLST